MISAAAGRTIFSSRRPPAHANQSFHKQQVQRFPIFFVDYMYVRVKRKLESGAAQQQEQANRIINIDMNQKYTTTRIFPPIIRKI